MILSTKKLLSTATALCILPAGLTGCKASGNESSRAASQPFMSAVASAPPQSADDTPVGRLSMKNIVVKIPGENPCVILLSTHYDTLLKDNFVGADDAGSSTAVMLELARLLCPQHGKYAVWIAFFDGEEAMKSWSDTDSRYGSRQMAARLSSSGDINKIKAFLLADIVGGRTAQFLRESSSNPAVIDLVWNTAAKLGYSAIFLNDLTSAQDDHDSFMRRGVPAVDVIGDFVHNGYWHTPQDALDKISGR